MMSKQKVLLIGLAMMLVAAAAIGAAYYRVTFTPGWGASQPELARQISDIVTAYRKLIVLVESEASMDASQQERIPIVGKMIFHENQSRLESLTAELVAEVERANIGKTPLVGQFLEVIESDSPYHDADKLAFAGVFEELSETLAQPGLAARHVQLHARVAEDLASLEEIQGLYEKELERIFARVETRGMPVRREAWESYVAFIKTQLSAPAILDEYPTVAASTQGTRGTRKKKQQREIFGTKLPAKTVVLTFDDGPHARHTDRILAILKKHGNPPSVFFQVGKNIGSIDEAGTIAFRTSAQAARNVIKAGHMIANHSYSHPVLTKLSQVDYTEEIQRTSQLIETVSSATPVMFRAPYGERNDAIIELLQSRHMRSVMWNVDSRDWADPIPSSIANRVLEVVRKENKGIILFHDIHSRTVKALPLVLEQLKAEGYRFAKWDGERFTVADSQPEHQVPTVSETEPQRRMYRESWAAVIGIDDYSEWPKLRYAVNDAEAIRELLVSRFRFKPENVFTLTNQEASREGILSLLGDRLADTNMVKRDDRVFVFFAGHGTTRRLPSGRDLGYIVPAKADLTNYQGQSISMTNFQDIAEAIPAKHVFFVMDSCYSGLGLTRGGRMQNYLKEITRRTARQMLTAGGADQEVADGGPNGHSIFTWTLMQALEGKGDLNEDGYITASELAAYVTPVVSSLSRQTPAFGNLPASEGGEFVFELNHESEELSQETLQLSDAAIALSKELDQLRVENEKLQKQLKVARANLQDTEPPNGRDRKRTASIHNDRGIALYREKRYEDALKEFFAATRADPLDAQFANNAGFAYYRLGENEQSVVWLKRAIELDPKRAVAYLNLGDTFFNWRRMQTPQMLSRNTWHSNLTRRVRRS